jgi:hypothetical protein
MITSPVNPMRYWKLEEIQSMLNKIEGYENIVIEFQCQRSDGWNKLNWDCKYGIKERLVNGQYNWLLKHVFVVEAKTELDAHNLAWQEAAERLVTDVWRTSIHSFRKEQREVDKESKQLEMALKKLENNITEDDLKIMDEINEKYKPKPKQWLRQAWYWVRGTLAFSVMVGVCWFIAEHKIVLDIFVWTLGLGLIGALIYCFKVLMGVAFKDDGFED